MVKHLWRICSRLFSCDQGVDGDGSGLPLRGDEGVLLVALLRIWFHFWWHRVEVFLVVCRLFCHATRDNSGVYDIFAIGYWVEFYLQEESDVTQDDHIDQQGTRRPISVKPLTMKHFMMRCHLFPRPPEFPGRRGGLTRVQIPSNNSFRPSWKKDNLIHS